MEKNNDNSEEEGKLSLREDLGKNLEEVKPKDKKKEEHNQPVFHLCHFKRLRDDEDSSSTLNMEASFIQVTFHKKKHDEKGAKEEYDTKPSFGYRINSKNPREEDCQLRNKTTIWESDDDYITKSTIDVLLPLEITPLLAMYPFTIYKAEVTIELVSKILDKVTFRPKIAINTKDLNKNFTIKINEVDLDKSKKFDFVTRCPSVQYFTDGSNGQQCKKFSVSFLLIDDGIGKFIKFYLPFFLICIISTVNALDDQHHEGGKKLDFADYIQTSSTMALAFVFLIPEAADTTRNQFLRSFGSTANAIFICLGLMLASFPPSFKVPYYKIGILFLWLSFSFPIYNFSCNYIITKRMKRESCKDSHFNPAEKGKFEIEDIKNCEYVASQNNNFFYPEDEETEVKKKVELEKKSKGFLYRRPGDVDEYLVYPIIIGICYICVVLYFMRKSLHCIIENVTVENIFGYNIIENITGHNIMENLEL